MRQSTDRFKVVKSGSVLLKENPFAHVLNSKFRSERCDFCFKKSDVLKCSSCGVTYFCDKACQRNGWSYHKSECSNLKKIGPRVVPDAARLIGRIIYYQEIKSDPLRMEHIEALTGVLSDYLGSSSMPNSVEFIRIYGKMVVNTFSILDGEMQSVGMGMYLGASIIDHSCKPNAVATFDGTTLIIRTLVDLPTLDWNKVFISYIDLLRYPSERQNELQETYYFSCQCERCQDVQELGKMTATICQNHSCGKDIPFGAKERRACNSCNMELSEETWEEIVEISEFTSQQLSAMKDVAYLDVCRTCLSKQEGLFSTTNVHRVKVLEMAMDSTIELGHWECALEYGRQLVAPFGLYYGPLHPLTGIFFLKMGKLALFLNKTEEAKEYLKEAAATLKITHGFEHPLVREELRSYLQQCA